MDKDGNPIMLNPIKPDNLPPFLMPVKLNISNVQNTDEKAAIEKTAQAAKKKGKGKGSRKGPRVAGDRQMDASYFIPSTSLTTTLSNTEPALNPGVSMRGRDNMLREGGELPEEYARPSRKAYAARVASASMVSPGLDVSMSRGGFGAGGLEESTASFGIGDINGGDSIDALPMSMTGMNLLQSKLAEPDIDPLEGSRRIERNQSSISQVE